MDDELFWGVDQLEYLELFLENRDPLAGVDLASRSPKGIGAHRKR